MTAAVTRKSLPLSERDLEELARLRESPTHRAAMETLTGQDPTKLSEAGLLRAVMDIGFSALLEQIEISGYAAMAADSDRDELRAVARRRRPDWADE